MLAAIKSDDLSITPCFGCTSYYSVLASASGYVSKFKLKLLFFPLVTFQLCRFPDPACFRDAEIEPGTAWRGREGGQKKHSLGEKETAAGTLSPCEGRG